MNEDIDVPWISEGRERKAIAKMVDKVPKTPTTSDHQCCRTVRAVALMFLSQPCTTPVAECWWTCNSPVGAYHKQGVA